VSTEAAAALAAANNPTLANPNPLTRLSTVARTSPSMAAAAAATAAAPTTRTDMPV
jgi:hypothetical protein